MTESTSTLPPWEAGFGPAPEERNQPSYEGCWPEGYRPEPPASRKTPAQRAATQRAAAKRHRTAAKDRKREERQQQIREWQESVGHIPYVKLPTVIHKSNVTGAFQHQPPKSNVTGASQHQLPKSNMVTGASQHQPPKTNTVTGASQHQPPKSNKATGASQHQPPKSNAVTGASQHQTHQPRSKQETGAFQHQSPETVGDGGVAGVQSSASWLGWRCPVCPEYRAPNEQGLVTHWLGWHRAGVVRVGCQFCDFLLHRERASLKLARHVAIAHLEAV